MISQVVSDIFAGLHGMHQREGVLWMCRRESRPGAVPTVAGGILADEMGLGKTYEIAAVMRLRPMRTLVVTTMSTIMQWQQVLSSNLQTLPFVLLGRGRAGDEVSRAETVLTTYSMFQRADLVPTGFEVPWGRIVLDEAHIVRNPKGNTYRSLCKLVAMHRWILTGTPVNNSMRDLDTLVAWLGAPGLELDMIREHLLLRRTKATEALRNPELAIPELTISDVVVAMIGPERRAYDLIYAAAKEHVHVAHPLAGLSGPPQVHVMEAILRCRQACTHVSIMHEAILQSRPNHPNPLLRAMSDPDITYAMNMQSTKLSKLVELVREHRCTEKSLIFCDWMSEMDIIEDALTTGVGVRVLRFHGVMGLSARDDTLRSFASMEEGTVLLIQIKCGGTGLNIQMASRVYLMRPSWNPCIEQQAIARVHRLGQRRTVVVTRLIAEDSIDVRCLDVQAGKLATIESVLA